MRNMARLARRAGLNTARYIRASELAWSTFGRTLFRMMHLFRLACGRARKEPSPTRAHFERVSDWAELARKAGR